MIDKNNDIQQRNIDLLIAGYWYEDLPPVIDIANMKEMIKGIIEKIDNDIYDDFYKTDGIITEYKNTQAPSYIFNDGIEPITFFEFKKNGALREMQIPNLKYYCTFVYNTIAVYDELFSKLYSEPEYDKYVCNSNSYILFNELFHIYKLYDGSEEIIESGIFAVKNNKITGQLAHEENNVRYLKKQGAKLHSVKVDIESFYPNVYTHYLSKIKDAEPYKDNICCDTYFDFLDYYNMKINNNQTKGIVTGVYSSTISAELLMLCVDYEINNVIGDEVTYIRYVDDLTFFSDSLEEIYSKLPLVQRVLNKYRLRINNNKTETQKSIYNMSYVDMYELKKRFDFFDFDSADIIKYDKEIFYNIKGYVARAYDNNLKSEIKAFLSMFRRAISLKKLCFDIDEKIDLKKHTVAYMLQLACLEPIFASRCYRVIISILDLIDKKNKKDEIVKLLKSKNDFINVTYHDSLLQIWHYYVLSKHDVKLNIKELLDSFGSDEINPIILAGFVKEKNAANKELFDYIKKTYSSIVYKEGESSYWMRSIMFSKWWLPLLVIYLKDGKNYSQFYESQHFHEIYKEMKEDK
ncbi:RNA-directed DNA polymerase [Eubacterium sp.]|uniref:RNA-directed DNA polymerase n=1 Tax=Eubacterium sp. TaxID=142586 RepID=UPI0035204F1E